MDSRGRFTAWNGDDLEVTLNLLQLAELTRGGTINALVDKGTTTVSLRRAPRTAAQAGRGRAEHYAERVRFYGYDLAKPEPRPIGFRDRLALHMGRRRRAARSAAYQEKLAGGGRVSFDGILAQALRDWKGSSRVIFPPARGAAYRAATSPTIAEAQVDENVRRAAEQMRQAAENISAMERLAQLRLEPIRFDPWEFTFEAPEAPHFEAPTLPDLPSPDLSDVVLDGRTLAEWACPACLTLRQGARHNGGVTTCARHRPKAEKVGER